jgi:hypothetical protein
MAKTAEQELKMFANPYFERRKALTTPGQTFTNKDLRDRNIASIKNLPDDYDFAAFDAVTLDDLYAQSPPLGHTMKWKATPVRSGFTVRTKKTEEALKELNKQLDENIVKAKDGTLNY